MPSSGSATKTRPRDRCSVRRELLGEQCARRDGAPRRSRRSRCSARAIDVAHEVDARSWSPTVERRSALAPTRRRASTSARTSRAAACRRDAASRSERSGSLATRLTRSLRSRMSRIFSGIQPSGRAAHRQLPRCGEELGRAAARVRVDLLHRRLPRDHGAVRARASCAQRRREMAVSLLAAGIDPATSHAVRAVGRCRNIPSWRGSSTPSRRSASSSGRRSSRKVAASRRA